MRHTQGGMTLIFDTVAPDQTPIRLLSVQGTFQSVTYLEEEFRNQLACLYHRSMAELIPNDGKHRRILVIGGGGYSLPKYLITQGRNLEVVVAEIDPKITALARQYFFLNEAEAHVCEGSSLTIQHKSGWVVLEQAQRAGETFDLIINDAFIGNKPLQLTKQVHDVKLIASVLNPDGIYCANVRCKQIGWGKRTIDTCVDELNEVFDHIDVIYEWEDDPRKPGNNVVTARKRS